MNEKRSNNMLTGFVIGVLLALALILGSVVALDYIGGQKLQLKQQVAQAADQAQENPQLDLLERIALAQERIAAALEELADCICGEGCLETQALALPEEVTPIVTLPGPTATPSPTDRPKPTQNPTSTPPSPTPTNLPPTEPPTQTPPPTETPEPTPTTPPTETPCVGNPGNNKCVGNAGEFPNGDPDHYGWPDNGDKGASNGDQNNQSDQNDNNQDNCPGNSCQDHGNNDHQDGNVPPGQDKDKGKKNK